jgi:hypothetical protein
VGLEDSTQLPVVHPLRAPGESRQISAQRCCRAMNKWLHSVSTDCWRVLLTARIWRIAPAGGHEAVNVNSGVRDKRGERLCSARHQSLLIMSCEFSMPRWTMAAVSYLLL